MALDQGTTSSRAVVFDHSGRVLGAAQEKIASYYPQPGWVEQEPEEIWETQLHCAREALTKAGLHARDLAALGVTNQRETALLWDAATGRTLGNAIVWQCRRTADRCEELRATGLEPLIQTRTGLRLDPYFSATKFEWLLTHQAEVERLLADSRLRAGTVDSFLVWRLTGGRLHVTDHTNASRTMLLDLRSLSWDPELLEVFAVPRAALPELVPSCGLLGETDPRWLGAPVPIAALIGDQQAALFGQGAFQVGDCKNTYGTGCFLLMDVGATPLAPARGLLSTVAWSGVPLAGGEATATYALEGSVFMAGGALQWMAEILGLDGGPAEIGPLAARAPDNGGAYFVPALTGLGTPYWDPHARGLLIGLTRATERAHLARAAEEAICLQTRAVVEAMQETSGLRITRLLADGGATSDDFLLQLQADLLGVPVSRRKFRESTALGAAALAGLAVGFWAQTEVAALAGEEQAFTPNLQEQIRNDVYHEWLRAAERAAGWAEPPQEIQHVADD